ncbi:MAG: element excision factor XisH family protein [Xenococcaceae cyanobacterium MO_207.B15]|nr:element excision factor XisH family protein [Xenococcaceae cyanobacterium MO_207.B15]MDJ0744826.1 element excision factor XisH family protein [Xenococcaceae cyanobacterium MO_167.B27]
MSNYLSKFHTALSQFLNYPVALESSDEPERLLYLAVPKDIVLGFGSPTIGEKLASA